MERVKVTIYTDPGCPFGFNAQRQETMRTEPSDRLAATIEACRAYVGARLNNPARANRLLRALRCRVFSNGQPLDQLETIHGAAADAGIETDAVDAWLADDKVEKALREDMAATRAPAPESVAEVLAWAPYPLATAEVAELRGISVDRARDELEQAGANLAESAGDGYWSTT